MPVAGKVPLKKLRSSLETYQQNHNRRITLEYVLLSGVNTGADEVAALQRFTTTLKVLINVIPFNRVEGLPFRPPAEEEVRQFVGFCRDSGYSVTRRYRRGEEIQGACGQLGGFQAGVMQTSP